jgi:hypothetical protein
VTVGELQSALDALGAEDLTPVLGPALLDGLGPLLVLQNRIAAEVTRAVRRCVLAGVAEHDGLETMASWLRGHAHLSATDAGCARSTRRWSPSRRGRRTIGCRRCTTTGSGWTPTAPSPTPPSALVQLCDDALASGNLPFLRTVKPHVVITIGIQDLLGPTAGTGFGATISPAGARWVACDATVSRMVLDPDGLPLDVGRTRRVVPAHIRRAVEERDRPE